MEVAKGSYQVEGCTFIQVPISGIVDKTDFVGIPFYYPWWVNVLTNMVGKASRVEIDFPKVDLTLAA